MPKSLRVCGEHGCPELTDHQSGRCQQHRREAWADTTPRLRGRQKTERNKRILRQHGGICHVCGQPGAITVDHIIPLAHGGTDADENLAPIHDEPCHRLKTQAEAVGGRGTPTSPDR